jgi:hypothetical protein
MRAGYHITISSIKEKSNMKEMLPENRLFSLFLRHTLVLACLVFTLLPAGCDSLRFAPGERQKQNAWLHHRTATVAADTAQKEQTSPELQALTKLSEAQSRAFPSYYGLPKECPPAETAQEILAQSNWQLADAAQTESAARPDPWQVADSVLELGIGIFGLLGGVCGTRVVEFLKTARTESQALKEIVKGNELFKKQNAPQAAAFKAAHQHQSAQTRQLVAGIKG